MTPTKHIVLRVWCSAFVDVTDNDEKTVSTLHPVVFVIGRVRVWLHEIVIYMVVTNSCPDVKMSS